MGEGAGAGAVLSEFYKHGPAQNGRLGAKGSFVMHVLAVSAITITSANPTRLAEFYREQLGIPLEMSSHGPIREHWEGWLGQPANGGIHIAVLKGPGASPRAGGVAPTFRVRELQAAAAALVHQGTEQVHRIADIGEGKRVASFRDPDGNVFRLLELVLP